MRRENRRLSKTRGVKSNSGTPSACPLIAPYGGSLVDLTVPVEAYDDLKAYAGQLPSIQISPRAVCDLELLATGAFSPLDRFMGREDHQRVVEEMRLSDGRLFPIPIALSVEVSPDLHLDRDIALRNSEFELLGTLSVEEIYQWDRTEVADQVYGTRDLRHPLVAEMQRWGPVNISGRLQILNLPRHFDFQELWMSPSQTRDRLTHQGQGEVAAYQPLGGSHRLSENFLEQVMEDMGAGLLLQLAAGLTRLGDVEHFTRVRYYQLLAERCSRPERILLSLLTLAKRGAGLRQTLWRALIQRNYGANHILVNQDHTGAGRSTEIKTFNKADDVWERLEKHSQELDLKMTPVPKQAVVPRNGGQRSNSVAIYQHRPGDGRRNNGGSLKREFSRPVAEPLLNVVELPRHRQGVCIWFTGLSGAGKSTTAEMLTWLLLEHGRPVTVLDGDIVRTHLSKGLGFSKEDRDTNVRRIGFVAAELVRLGGAVICAVVSPYRAARNDVRNMVGEDRFVEVYVDTPLEVCEARDVKGLYARARRGAIQGFTGIDDPYEPPIDPELTLDTIKFSPQENANLIIERLIAQGFIQCRAV